MSLHALPTGLDTKIIEYLEHKACNNISRVSRYNRKISKPLLYDRIHLQSFDSAGIKLLLTTLLGCDDLLYHTHSVYIECNEDCRPVAAPPDPDVFTKLERGSCTDEPYNLFGCHLMMIKEHIDSLVDRIFRLMSRWLG
ncbi:hypothetical protein CC86DRAFT_156088 [Ophiobolus disseminans]|uniref:F-box domain-containing protein n=1 Tax=Ophiobolus disseminans TaxID=1469910 RepID=A0A6A6ZC38_9PLEO|nr:hypothetical protein CC86DRAFT_156088 [Ophiobolus disseminans]